MGSIQQTGIGTVRKRAPEFDHNRCDRIVRKRPTQPVPDGMNMKLLLGTAAALGAVAALAQLRITSFDSSGELTWTNPIQRGLYSVESGSTLAGPWSPLVSVVDKDGAKTNRITLQVPLANGPAFYRIGWVPPDPVGAWDYRGYDNEGTLETRG